MTSDAKIGLLLGLVFIFIIAFLINGLPNFRHNTNTNELTTNMTSFKDDSPGIGTKERKAQESLNWPELLEKQTFGEVQTASEAEPEVRSVTPLPQSTQVAKEPHEITETQPETAMVQPSSVSTKENDDEKPQLAKITWPKIYVVNEGDNLANIAKKFYGPQAGNKRININKIFEANRQLLSSPDEIYVGQKLIIPPPSNLARDESKTDSVLSRTLFEKVKSIGRKHFSVEGRADAQSRWYVVLEGDSLWKIAAEQLGNGSRYREISKLNADILDDEDNLVVGMRLRMPAR
ncbi:MAG: LysM peptidoglycan-binding domain-containing protein [Sedimentisphaerales bacterium]